MSLTSFKTHKFFFSFFLFLFFSFCAMRQPILYIYIYYIFYIYYNIYKISTPSFLIAPVGLKKKKRKKEKKKKRSGGQAPDRFLEKRSKTCPPDRSQTFRLHFLIVVFTCYDFPIGKIRECLGRGALVFCLSLRQNCRQWKK